MLIQSIKTLLKNLGFAVDGKSDDELLRIANEAGIKETPIQPATTQPSSSETPLHNRSIIENQQQQISELNTKIDSLMKIIGDERTAREKANDALKQDAENKRNSEIKKIIDDAVKVGKIPNSEEAKSKWEKRFKDSYEVSKDALSEIPENPSLVRQSSATTVDKSTTTVSPSGTLNRSELMRNAADFINAQTKQ